MNGSPGCSTWRLSLSRMAAAPSPCPTTPPSAPTWRRWTCKPPPGPCHAAPAFQRGAARRAVDKANPNFLLFIILSSDTGSRDVRAGRLHGPQRAARDPARARRRPGQPVWRRARDAHLADLAKLVGYRLTRRRERGHPGAERPGGLRDPGDLPNVDAPTPLRHRRGARAAEHGRAVRRHRAAPTPMVRPCLRDVACIELGAQSYAGRTTRINGKPSVGIGVLPAPAPMRWPRPSCSNSVLKNCALLPRGREGHHPHDSSLFIELSISGGRDPA